MKKYTIFVLIFIFIFSVVGCNKNPENLSSTDTTTSGIIYTSDPDDTNNTNNTSSDNNGSDKNGISSDDKSDNESDTNSGNNNNNDSSNDKSENNNNGNNTNNNKNPQNGDNELQQNNTSNQNNNNNESNNLNSNNSNNSSTQSNSSKPNSENNEYINIPCRTVADTDWKKIELVSKTNKLYISLSVPKDWEIKDDGLIYRNDVQIGTISSKKPTQSLASFEETDRQESNVVFKKSVEKYIFNDVKEFKRIFKASQLSVSGAKNLNITLNYSELDSSATQKLFNSFSYCGVDRKMPVLSDENNSGKKLLILGNSFLTSSKIADFLSDMLITDGAKYVVESKVISGAEVADFANDSQLIEKIESKVYAYVFQCGFYTDEKSWGTSEKSGPLQKIIDACKKSNTNLVVFPAHNESTPVINRALDKYSDIYFINWKNEIDNLINSGIGESSPTQLTTEDFCENDQQKHSTPLAGYVGAHMIYRNIFGKIPPALSTTAPLDMAQIDSKLLSYSSTGIVPGKSVVYKYYI